MSATPETSVVKTHRRRHRHRKSTGAEEKKDAPFWKDMYGGGYGSDSESHGRRRHKKKRCHDKEQPCEQIRFTEKFSQKIVVKIHKPICGECGDQSDSTCEEEHFVVHTTIPVSTLIYPPKCAGSRCNE